MGVNNPTGDLEIFTIRPDGTGLKQLTNNTTLDFAPVVSPDGTKIAYQSQGDSSNSGGDYEIYVMNALDGSNQKNLTNNDAGVYDFSPDGKKIAYWSEGKQTSNPEGDSEFYVMSTLDGSGKLNVSNDAEYDEDPDWGKRTM
jgi:Tol biopolymer transport system component